MLGPLKAKAAPYLYVTVEVTAAVLDLTDRGTRRRLRITLDDLLVPTKKWDAAMSAGKRSATHHIGKLALDDGRFDGILYPPYPWRKLLRKKGKYNLALFMDDKAPGMAKPRGSAAKLVAHDPHGVLSKLGLIL